LKRIRFAAGFIAVLMLVTSVVQATEPKESSVVLHEEAIADVSLSVDDWKLLLVNPWNQIPENYKIVHKKLANGLTVDERIYDDLSAMLSDCWKAGLKPIVCSAYRSQATQQRLYRNKITRLRAAGYGYESAVKEAGRWVAVPGTSEHHTGMALDIVSSSYQILDTKQEETPEQKWLMEHCWEYGFILRYPSDKSELTGIGYEPWHYRYVGREASMAIKERGFCLEEYIEFLKEEPHALFIEDEIMMYQ